MTDIPVLTTERLVMRGPSMADFPPYAAFYASDRAIHVGGPKPLNEAWKNFAGDAGTWALRGFGWWTVTEAERPAGFVGIHHPPHQDDMEIGWVVYASAEGRGIAREAAMAALRWTAAHLRPARLVSYIAEGNAASERLAERLGATREATRARHDATCHVYRHDLTGYAP